MTNKVITISRQFGIAFSLLKPKILYLFSNDQTFFFQLRQFAKSKNIEKGVIFFTKS